MEPFPASVGLNGSHCFKMADQKYRFFSISAYISLRIMILVSTYTFSEKRNPLQLIWNHFQPQLVSVAAIFSKCRPKIQVFQYFSLYFTYNHDLWVLNYI